MKKFNSKNDTMNESQLKRVYSHLIYSRDSEIYSDIGFVDIDNGSVGGSHWTCFLVKDIKSHYFDSFGVHPDKFLLNRVTSPKIYHNYKIQDIKSKLCGSYCLLFFYLIERINYYDVVLKMYFESISSF